LKASKNQVERQYEHLKLSHQTLEQRIQQLEAKNKLLEARKNQVEIEYEELKLSL